MFVKALCIGIVHKAERKGSDNKITVQKKCKKNIANPLNPNVIHSQPYTKNTKIPH